MRPFLVVIATPSVGQVTGVEDVREDVGVQELISYSTVERFDVCVLRRFSRIDEMQSNVAIGSPLEHCTTRKLRTVVKANRRRQLTSKYNILKNAQDVGAAECIANLKREAFSSKIVDDVHGTD